MRDGLKPVQRRILYAMYANLHLHPDGRFRKSMLFQYPLPENIGITLDVDRNNVVKAVLAGSPAEKAGLRVGDAVLAVAGGKPSSLADLFRRIWACGNAGVRVPLKVLRETATKEYVLESADRHDFLKKPHLH